MSDRPRITQKLRDSMQRYDNFDGTSRVVLGEAGFDNLCDAIDSIHAALEAGNENLEAELDRVTMDQEGTKDYYRMGYDDGYEAGTLTATYDMDNARLKDMDGVPINVGDVMEWSDGKTFEVVGIGDGTLFYAETEENGSSRIEWTSCVLKRHHHHAPTVEDVLREFANEVYADADNEIRDRDFLCAKYAKRLTLAGDAE